MSENYMSEFTNEQKSDASQSAGQSQETLLNRAESALEEGKNYVKSNPMPIIAGALAVGFVLGLLVPREKPTPRLLDGRVDELKDLLSSLGARVSSTAEDGYSEVSSAIGEVLKKARKRFNFS